MERSRRRTVAFAAAPFALGGFVAMGWLSPPVGYVSFTLAAAILLFAFWPDLRDLSELASRSLHHVKAWLGITATDRSMTLLSPRAKHLSARTPDGKLLLFKGRNRHGITESVELIDPNTETSEAIRGLELGRSVVQCTVLPEPDGRIVLAGDNGSPDPLRFLSLEDGRPSVSRSGSPTSVPHGHLFTATVLDDGRLLLVGASQSNLDCCTEVYDPDADAFTQTDNLEYGGMGRHTATLRRNYGSVLIAGGGSNRRRRAELWNPDGSTEVTADLVIPRLFHTATRLLNGDILMVGGKDARGTIEEFHAGDFSLVHGVELHVPRYHHTADLLPDGSVLMVGGLTDNRSPEAIDVIERYLPRDEEIEVVGRLRSPRVHHTTAVLSDGSVLVIGGMGQKDDGYLAECETIPRSAWAG